MMPWYGWRTPLGMSVRTRGPSSERTNLHLRPLRSTRSQPGSLPPPVRSLTYGGPPVCLCRNRGSGMSLRGGSGLTSWGVADDGATKSVRASGVAYEVDVGALPGARGLPVAGCRPDHRLLLLGRTAHGVVGGAEPGQCRRDHHRRTPEPA